MKSMTRFLGTIGLLPGIITVLALADGALHLLLDVVLFHGNFWGGFAGPGGDGAHPGGAPLAPGGPGAHPGIAAAHPPMASISLPLPTNELFVLNCLGYIALVLVFWFGPRWRWLEGRRWLVDSTLILYTAASIVAWLAMGRPNPNGLGYLSKGLEIGLILALGAHLWQLLKPRIAGQARLAARIS